MIACTRAISLALQPRLGSQFHRSLLRAAPPSLALSRRTLVFAGPESDDTLDDVQKPTDK
eukprot:CAMPEP_0185753322 /NCGR_PEP_ID=MMETSP1174-20130828/12047_1 /TAXON_ID=35687 /ORGANISM="Dictyocha speculum, Strain CCMP1381" /LENGTH=59 /DNA_ID=CAMNT_0028431107 /DNA_START=37 /DNA_END=213 /DNA_ORIENTATION=+